MNWTIPAPEEVSGEKIKQALTDAHSKLQEAFPQDDAPAEENPMVPADNEDAPDRWFPVPNRVAKRDALYRRGIEQLSRSRIRRRVHRTRRKVFGW